MVLQFDPYWGRTITMYSYKYLMLTASYFSNFNFSDNSKNLSNI